MQLLMCFLRMDLIIYQKNIVSAVSAMLHIIMFKTARSIVIC